ncbi:MAG: DUF5703 domain-containing protein [Tepidisphaerales bacterium]
MKLPITAGLMLLATLAGAEPPANSLDAYNVVWTSPSRDSSGSMPLGNGDVGLNVWMEPSGDLVFYLSKTDAFSENGQLLKLGRVRVKLDPNPLAAGAPFRQELKLASGTIEFSIGQPATTLRVWVDANRPAVHVDVRSAAPTSLTASLELWRNKAEPLPKERSSAIRELEGSPQPVIIDPDTVLPAKDNRLVWFHRNARSTYSQVLENQHLKPLLEKHPDPLLGKTFGACMLGSGLAAADGRTLRSAQPGTTHSLRIHVLSAQTPGAEAWSGKLADLVRQSESTPDADAWVQHQKWWSDFWNRSWVFISGKDPIPATATAGATAANTLPVRVGADSNGQNRFRGKIGQVRIWSAALDDRRVEELAKLDRVKSAGTSPELIAEWPLERAGDSPNLKAVGNISYADAAAVFDGNGHLEMPHDPRFNLDGSFTLEAWIAPEVLGGGGARILDKCPVATANGWTFDTHPGNSLRLITSAATIGAPAKLPPKQWSHVVAVRDAGAGTQALYLNGRRLSGDDSKPKDSPDLTPAQIVTRGYILQRFIAACAGRGPLPIKFNGSIFTVDHLKDPDFRAWGGCYWFQNTRLAYWPMLAAGDFEMMRPFFEMYRKGLPLAIDRTRLYYGHAGACFPETMYFWCTPCNPDFGWGYKGPETVNGYIKYYWSGGIELTAMMLDYYDITQDRDFAGGTLLPVADAVTTFFDQHWKRDASGKIRFDPAASLETWHAATNPTPEIAGLRFILPRLLALPSDLTTDAQRAMWKKTLADLPAIPLGEKAGRHVILPAEKFDRRSNSENPELYAVFPYRMYAPDKPGLEIARDTFAVRTNRHNHGWCQDSIQAACLGLGNEAANMVAPRAAHSHTGSRFPAFWGPNFDWVPDQDHGSNILTTVQCMLLQTDGRKILLLPAWPKQWDVDFRLHAPYQTTVEGQVRGGKLIELKVTPEARRADVVIGGL